MSLSSNARIAEFSDGCLFFFLKCNNPPSKSLANRLAFFYPTVWDLWTLRHLVNSFKVLYDCKNSLWLCKPTSLAGIPFYAKKQKKKNNPLTSEKPRQSQQAKLLL